MAGMKQVRVSSAKHADATRGAAEYFLDFVQRSPEAFQVGLRELHGGSKRMRAIFRRVVDDIALESVDQITSLNLVPGLQANALLPATKTITYYMFYRALDAIDEPRARVRIADDIVAFIRAQFFGAIAQQAAESKSEKRVTATGPDSLANSAKRSGNG